MNTNYDDLIRFSPDEKVNNNESSQSDTSL